MAAELTWGDVPILFDRGDRVQAFLDKYQPLDALFAAVYAPDWSRKDSEFYRGLWDYLPRWPAPPPLRLNQLYWPTGATRWAFGAFLVAAASIPLVRGLPRTLTWDDDAGGRIETEMYCLAERAVTVELPGQGDKTRLAILPLVDARYFWQFAPVGEIALDTESDWSLDGDLQIEQALEGHTINEFTPSADFLCPDPEELSRRHDNAAALMDAAAWSTGRRVVRRLDGIVRVETAAAGNDTLDGNQTRLAGLICGGKPLYPTNTPDVLRITFPRLIDHIPCSHLPVTRDASLIADGHEDADTAGGTLTIHSTCYAIGTDPEALDNAEELEELAEAIAGAVLDWDKQFAYTFAGCHTWTITGHCDYLLYTFGAQHPTGYAATQEGDEEDAGETSIEPTFQKIATTQVVSLPFNVWPAHMLQQSAAALPLRGPQLAILDEQLTWANRRAAAQLWRFTRAGGYSQVNKPGESEWLFDVWAWLMNSADVAPPAGTPVLVKPVHDADGAHWEIFAMNCQPR